MPSEQRCRRRLANCPAQLCHALRMRSATCMPPAAVSAPSRQEPAGRMPATNQHAVPAVQVRGAVVCPQGDEARQR